MKKIEGFSLVELMVGMLIGLIGTVVIFQVFAIAEGQKRTTTSGGDAAQSAAFALFSIERELRISGLGFNNAGLMGCTLRIYDDDLPDPKSRLQSLAPGAGTAGTGNVPDTFSVSYSSNALVSPPLRLSNSVTGNGTILVADGRGFTQPGDVMVLADLEAGEVRKISGVPKHCVMFQVSSLPAGNQELAHAPAGTSYTAPGNVTRPVRYNHPTDGLNNGLPSLTFPPADNNDNGGFIYKLGDSVVSATYYIDNNRLMRRDDLGDTAKPFEIADGIVQMKVMYGIDANDNNQIATSEWTNLAPTTTATMKQLRAVKVALVARSALKEKANPGSGVCETTAAYPQWYGASSSGADIALDVSADPDWKCYRYKVLQTVVAIRNRAWVPYR